MRARMTGVLLVLGVMITPLGSHAQGISLKPASDRGGCAHNGDVNEDGIVTPMDALLAFRYFLQPILTSLTPCQQDRADVDEPAGGTITPQDARCILQKFLSLPSCFGQSGQPVQLQPVVASVAHVVENGAIDLVVRVTDAEERPVEAASVTFRLRSGMGTLAESLVRTDVNGQATTTFTGVQVSETSCVEAAGDGLPPVVFAVTGVAEENVRRVIPVRGNTQPAAPGEVLDEPLVVQVETQFGNPQAGAVCGLQGAPSRVRVAQQVPEASTGIPVAGVRVTAALIQGQAQFVTPTDRRTDARGEAAFNVRVGQEPGEQDIRVRVSAPDLPQANSVTFLAIVGAKDTPDRPRALAIAEPFAFVADRFSPLQVIDIRIPTDPQVVNTVDLVGSEERLALSGNRAYVATDFPPRLYILDISNPQAADFPMQTNDDCLPLGRPPGCVTLMGGANHSIAGIVVQNGFAYIVTEDQISGSGTLQVIDVSDPLRPAVVGFLPLAGLRPQDIAVFGDLAYIPAGAAGLLIAVISNPSFPFILPQALPGNFLTGIAISGDFAYVVEQRAGDIETCPGQACSGGSCFTVLDLQIPFAPQRRGMVQTRQVRQMDTRFPISIAGRFAYLGEFSLGLQVIDIANPDAPFFLGRIDTPSEVLTIVATDAFVYVTDLIFGLQVVRGPGGVGINVDRDADGDGVVNVFDLFPDTPMESRDTDGDGIGDNADLDDDNDGFADGEECQATPATDALDARDFPPRLPPVGTSTLVVDANSNASPRDRDGTPERPYRSITEALRAIRVLRNGQVSQDARLTLEVRAGRYSSRTTQEIFPLDFFSLSSLTMQGAGRVETVIDAAFAADVISLIGASQIVITGFTVTHGALGFFIDSAEAITLQQNRIHEHAFDGIEVGTNAEGIAIGMNANNDGTDNIVENNTQVGIRITENANATIAGNTIRTNAEDGIIMNVGSMAMIEANVIASNGDEGITVDSGATATITGNLIRDNADFGVLVRDRSTAEITQNTIAENMNTGVAIAVASEAIMQDNVIRANGQDGIFVNIESFAAIQGGEVTENNGNGIFIVGNSRADIGPAGRVAILSGNSAAGIGVVHEADDLSVAGIGIGQENVVFSNGSNFVPDLIFVPAGPYVRIP